MNIDIKQKISGFIQLIAVIIFIGAALAFSALLQSSKKPIQNGQKTERILFVEADSFSPAPYALTINTTGTIESRAAVEVVSQVSGRITAVNDNFYEGGRFTAGEMLFQIDPRDFELEVQRLEAEVASAQTTLELEQAESLAALEEWKMLNGSKAAPDLVLRKPQQQEAAARLKAAEAQLANARLDLERTTFTLPFDGRVLSSSVNIGQYIAAGQSYGSVFDLKSLEVQSTIDENKIKFLSPAESLDVKITAQQIGESKSYTGYLKRSAAALDTQTRFAPVTFGLKDQSSDLIPGSFVNIAITTPPFDDILAVPTTARQKDGSIWQIREDSSITPLTGYHIVYNDGQTLALSGVSQNVRLVISSLPGAIDGMRVQIREAREE